MKVTLKSKDSKKKTIKSLTKYTKLKWVNL